MPKKNGISNNKTINDFVNTVKEVLFNPMEFFEKVPKEKGMKKALIFYLFVTIIIGLTFTLIGLPWMAIQSLAQGKIGTLIMSPIMLLLIIPLYLVILVFAYISLFISSLIYQILFMIFKGKGSFEDTVKIICYSRTAQIFTFVPFMNFFVGIYGFILTCIGFKKIHKLSWGMTILVALIPAIIVFILVILFIIIIFITLATGTLAAIVGGV